MLEKTLPERGRSSIRREFSALAARSFDYGFDCGFASAQDQSAGRRLPIAQGYLERRLEQVLPGLAVFSG
jgi:hypothetical protein